MTAKRHWHGEARGTVPRDSDERYGRRRRLMDDGWVPACPGCLPAVVVPHKCVGRLAGCMIPCLCQTCLPGALRKFMADRGERIRARDGNEAA